MLPELRFEGTEWVYRIPGQLWERRGVFLADGIAYVTENTMTVAFFLVFVQTKECRRIYISNVLFNLGGETSLHPIHSIM